MLNTVRINELVVDPKKAHMFMREVEFCVNILLEVRRSPAQVKLMSIQKWEIQATILKLRGFLA